MVIHMRICLRNMHQLKVVFNKNTLFLASDLVLRAGCWQREGNYSMSQWMFSRIYFADYSIWTIYKSFFNNQFYFLYFYDPTLFRIFSYLYDYSFYSSSKCSLFSIWSINNIHFQLILLIHLINFLHLLPDIFSQMIPLSWCFKYHL